MTDLYSLENYIGTLLRHDTVPDYPNAINGLQLENSGEVRKIVAAVDAVEATINKAIAARADLLLVHHGLFWQGAQPIKGATFRKLQKAMENDLAIYSSHIPLDVHPDLGNNVQLGRALNLGHGEPFFSWKGIQLGMRYGVEIARDALLTASGDLLGPNVHICPGGPQTCRQVGIITGGAGTEVMEVARTGIDTFITGEGQHWTWTLAEELGINLIYGGHYATETFGVKALAAHLADKFDLEWEFIDHPTGL